MLVLRAITLECSILVNGEVKVNLGRSCRGRVQSRAPGACTSTCRVAMAHSHPVRISVAEMKLYYIYSEWCSWLHCLAEGECWGPLRKGHTLQPGCSVAGILLMKEVVSPVPVFPLDLKSLGWGPGAHKFLPCSWHWIILWHWLPRVNTISQAASVGTPTCHQAVFMIGSLGSYKTMKCLLSEHPEGPSLSLELNVLQSKHDLLFLA